MIIRPEGCICKEFNDTAGFRIADLTCPVHGVGGTDPGDDFWEMLNDLPAIYHEHSGPTAHKHEKTGFGHYVGETGHYHLTQVFTPEEIRQTLGLEEE